MFWRIQKWLVTIVKASAPSGWRRLRRVRILKSRHGLANTGSDSDYVVVGSTFGRHCRISGRIVVRKSRIGDYSYIECGSQVSRSEIGKFCSIGPYCIVGASGHPSKGFVSTHPLFYLKRPQVGYKYADRNYFEDFEETRIGNDVWIGAGVCIKGGLSIGDGAIIGAGAVVTKNVPPYAIYGGVPAGLIRYRFDEGTIRKLLALRWWDKGEEWLEKNWRLFHDVRGFVDAFEDCPTEEAPGLTEPDAGLARANGPVVAR